MSQETKKAKKTPSARVIAAMWLITALDTASADDYTTRGLSEQELTTLADSRVSTKKAKDVITQVDKIAGRLRARAQAIVDKFEGKTPPKTKPKKQAGADDPKTMSNQ